MIMSVKVERPPPLGFDAGSRVLLGSEISLQALQRSDFRRCRQALKAAEYGKVISLYMYIYIYLPGYRLQPPTPKG